MPSRISARCVRADRKMNGTAAVTSSAVPLLGASGPATLGSTNMAIRLVRAIGGSAGFLAISFAETELSDFPLPGLTALVDPLASLILIPLVTVGAGGEAGAGSYVLPVTVAPAFVGTSFFHQAFVFDGSGPSGVATSNGLEITYAP